MPLLTETAYAKINLALHVRRRRNDGYHELETLFAFADQGDVLSAELSPELSPELSLTIVGPFADGLSYGDDNLVFRAASALRPKGMGAKITLHKNLPIASGIGGGSADAAAALRLLSRLWLLDDDLLPIATALGADVPACLYSETLWGEGIGEKLEPWLGEGITGSPLLLVNPAVPCPTGPIFSAWDGQDRGALHPEHWIAARNDLQIPAVSLVPEIKLVLALLQAQPGHRIVRMSGSGATCFALFDCVKARDAACATVSAKHSEWWTMAASLR